MHQGIDEKSVSRDIALVLCAREPKPGAVKSRLAAVIGVDAACEIYAAMAADIWRSMKSPGFPCILATDGEGNSWLPDPADVLIQLEGRFGERLVTIIRKIGEDGYTSVIVLGADTPLVSSSMLNEAASALIDDEVDVVTSPADDGGLVLFGLKIPPRMDVTKLPWESDGLDDAVVERCVNMKFRHLLPGSYDIDVIEDIHRLRNEPDEVKSRCPLTISAIERLMGS